MLTVDIDGLERVQADYRGRLRAVLERELEELDRRAQLAAPQRPELHEIDLAAVEPPAEETEIPEAVESVVMAEPPAAEADLTAHGKGKGNGNGNGNGHGADADGGPPTEALLVIEDELADNGAPGPLPAAVPDGVRVAAPRLRFRGVDGVS